MTHKGMTVQTLIVVVVILAAVAIVVGPFVERALEQRQQQLDRELCDAAYHGEWDEVRRLLSRGANTNTHARGRWGETPLHDAAPWGDKDVGELLLGKGADVNATNMAGVTPLHMAAMMGHTDLADLLLRRGAATTS